MDRKPQRRRFSREFKIEAVRLGQSGRGTSLAGGP